MIAPEAGLSVTRQCALLGIARSSFYYRPRPEAAEELDLLKRLDRIFTNHPVYGSRRLQVALLREGISIGRRRVRRLMRKLGLWAVRPKRNSSKRHPEHKVYPYLLRGKTIDRPNQVWAADVTYIPMLHGFLYLVAIIDWATRRVLSWRLSNTQAAGFCVEALSEALARFGTPGTFNTDQGAQFTSDEFTKVLSDHGIEISMDGRGRCHDNIFVERLWWTVKHEWVYLRAQPPTASNRSAALPSSSTGIISSVRIRRSAGAHQMRLISPNQRQRRHWLPDAMPSRCCEFVDSRRRRSAPDRASAVPYGQAGENAMRFPHLAHRSAAAHKLHSTPQQDGINLISGNHQTSSRLPAFSLFLPGSCPNNRDHRTVRFRLSGGG
jgi:putative transposase